MQRWLSRLRWPRRILRVVLLIRPLMDEDSSGARAVSLQPPSMYAGSPPFITRRHLIDILRPQASEKILEVGPGTGYYSLSLAKFVQPEGLLHLLDIQQEMLDHTLREASKADSANIRAVQADAMKLPYRDHTFDAAVLVTVLGEIPDEAQALAELRRLLKQNGRLVIGKVIFDPHFVPLAAATRRAEAHGFRCEQSFGPPFGYFARFTKADAGASAATFQKDRRPEASAVDARD